MITVFSNRERALVFVHEQRVLGNEAELIHDHSSSLWGPSAVGGCRVLHWSEGELEETDNQPRPDFLETIIRILFWIGRMLVIGLIIFAAADFVFGVLYALYVAPMVVIISLAIILGLGLLSLYLAAIVSLFSIKHCNSRLRILIIPVAILAALITSS